LVISNRFGWGITIPAVSGRFPFSQTSGTAKLISAHIGGNAAQPGQKTALLWLKRSNSPYGRKPGFLNDLVRLIALASTSPDDVTIELIECFQTPHAPRIFIPCKHRPAQNLFPVNAVFRLHAAGSMVTVGVSEVLLSDGKIILP
jgi:hypothetical protein